ncbi:MAG: hypothetical protein R3C53_23115 [Pirellulaceae bacterium]
MTQFRCPACSKVLQAPTTSAGKKVKCPCGHVMAVPFQATPSTQSSVTAAPMPKNSHDGIVVTCQCGKRLRAPATATGKAIKCPCGAVIQVPTPTYDDFQPLDNPQLDPFGANGIGANGNWLSDLPGAAAAPMPASNFQAPAYAAPPSYQNANAYSGNAYTESQSKKAASNRYLAQAHEDLDKERRQSFDAGSGGGIMNSGVVGGLLAMIGAVVWFVAGLSFGVIFFYPPILFIIGFIGLVRGLLDS